MLVQLIVSSLAVFISGYILPGVHISDFLTAIIVAVVLGVLNLFVKPILVLLTLPITIFTLGLFYFVLNAVIILLASSIVPGFKVDGFWWALIYSLVLTFVSSFLYSLTNTPKS